MKFVVTVVAITNSSDFILFINITCTFQVTLRRNFVKFGHCLRFCLTTYHISYDLSIRGFAFKDYLIGVFGLEFRSFCIVLKCVVSTF